MARAQLHDDRPPKGHAYPPTPAGWHVALDDDLCPAPLAWSTGVAPDGEWAPVLVSSLWDMTSVTIRSRRLAGVDDDGNALWEWAVVAEGVPAAESPQPVVELDDTTGRALWVTRITIDLPAMAVSETATVEDISGNMWGVVGSSRAAGTLTLQLQRVAHSNDRTPIATGAAMFPIRKGHPWAYAWYRSAGWATLPEAQIVVDGEVVLRPSVERGSLDVAHMHVTYPADKLIVLNLTAEQTAALQANVVLVELVDPSSGLLWVVEQREVVSH